MKMRHQTQLEVSTPITVDEKIIFLLAVKSAQNLIYTDVVSEAGETLVSMYFSTEDGDEGRIQVYDDMINIFVGLSFTRLIDLHTFIADYFKDTLVDLVNKYGGQNPTDPDPDFPSA